MGCFCKAVVVNTPPPCKGRCLRLSTIRIGCDDGPTCNEMVQVDLTEYNDVSQGVDVKYKLTKTEYPGFTSVTLTEAGILTFTTDDTITANEEEEIEYRAYESNGLLSATACLYVCSKDECKGVDYDKETQVCNSCDGTVQNIVDIDVTGDSSGVDISVTGD